MTSTELVPTGNMAELDTLDGPSREVAVTRMLGEARTWLAHAVEATEPARAAEFKAWIATIAESTKQLNLSKEIQQDALEMVRRAERGVGSAVRAGQEAGEIRVRNPAGEFAGNQHVPGRGQVVTTTSATEFFSGGQDRTDIYAMADAPSEVFEEAIQDAKEEGNLSRANVLRKIQGVKSDKLSPTERVQRITALSTRGLTSGQIGQEIGHSEDYIRRIAKANHIEIPADRVMNGSRRGVDPNQVVQEAVNTLEGLMVAVRLINFDGLEIQEHWVSSLSESIKGLTGLRNKLKEMTQ